MAIRSLPGLLELWLFDSFSPSFGNNKFAIERNYATLNGIPSLSDNFSIVLQSMVFCFRIWIIVLTISQWAIKCGLSSMTPESLYDAKPLLYFVHNLLDIHLLCFPNVKAWSESNIKKQCTMSIIRSWWKLYAYHKSNWN